MEDKFEKNFKITLLVLLAIIAVSFVYIAYCITMGFSDISMKLFELNGTLINLLGG